jgi:DinB family
MQHLANHSTYHRGQIALMMRQLDAEPQATDFHMFLYRRPRDYGSPGDLHGTSPTVFSETSRVASPTGDYRTRQRNRTVFYVSPIVVVVALRPASRTSSMNRQISGREPNVGTRLGPWDWWRRVLGQRLEYVRCHTGHGPHEFYRWPVLKIRFRQFMGRGAARGRNNQISRGAVLCQISEG